MCWDASERRGEEPGWRRGGEEVSRALMFPGQETPSPSCTLYLSARSPIFIRLYLRLESVPLHFLSRSSSSSSFSLPHPPSPSLRGCVYTALRLRTSPRGGDAAAATTCKHSPLLFAIRMPPKPAPVREEPAPSLSIVCMYIYVCVYVYVYIYIQVAILLAGGKISSSLLRYEEKSARWNVSFFTPFSRVFFTACSFEKGEGIGCYRWGNFFDSSKGASLEVRSGARLKIYWI